ncbi:hypothetical protein FBU59_004083 [Linderina macrospora]|uniref:Uncharacterized protein n=1 Tax=Linderina macrospora TaxID=4868 RepID=A0ACC1J6G1_9FUNG|nr:hypothetical protein FBU59_004083 [Linderina macrospora]
MWASKYLVRLRKQMAIYTDKRMRATREALQGMKVIKLFVWEDSTASTIRRYRNQEIKLIAYINLMRYGLISLALNSPVLASILTFAILTTLGGKLHAGAVFAVIGIFNSISVPLSWLPVALTEARNSKVPLERIADVLLEEELDMLAAPQPKLDVAIRVSHGNFAWKYQAIPASSLASDTSREPRIHHLGGPRKRNAGQDENNMSLYTYRFPAESVTGADGEDSQPFHLDNINLELPHGSLAVIVGPVGSGKSSLISALVGEMKRISGGMDFGGTLSYAAQVPWIMNATIRDNITFGLPYDEERYINVIEACALDIDLAEFADRDMTEIGERGVTLSGGQKQRVSIARAAYSESDIVLLDDSLSAVDVSVSHSIFKYCIQGYLKNRTRVLVTHCLDYLPLADLVITVA